MSRAGDDSGISPFKSKGQGTRRQRNRDVWRPVILAPLALGQHDAAEVMRWRTRSLQKSQGAATPARKPGLLIDILLRLQPLHQSVYIALLVVRSSCQR
jgi:hypothetical protein